MVLELTAIVAIADATRGIGKKNDLPWSISEDWNYFLKFIKTTKNENKVNGLIMGRKTWESIPEDLSPFKPCVNVIVSSSLKKDDLRLKHPSEGDHVLLVDSFSAGVDLLNNHFNDRVEKIIAIGGTSIYKTSLESENFKRLFLTRVFGQFECDVFLEPENFLDNLRKMPSEKLIEETSLYECDYNQKKIEPKNSIEYIFEVYEKL